MLAAREEVSQIVVVGTAQRRHYHYTPLIGDNSRWRCRNETVALCRLREAMIGDRP